VGQLPDHGEHLADQLGIEGGRLPLPPDVVRALGLDARFKTVKLGLVDGMVIAVAERRRVHRVPTRDHRDLAAVRVGPRLARSFELLP
jgi:hypothetical protein